MNKKLIISAAITGTAGSKVLSPYIPIDAAEIAEEAVAVAKAGAAIVHIHVHDDNGDKTMDTGKFEEAFKAVKSATEAAGIDVVVNLTTSGGSSEDEVRMAHLKKLRPEMCSYDSGSFNWNNGNVFLNSAEFLAKLSQCVVENDIKPEFEIFDSGMLGNAVYNIKNYNIPTPCHFQFVLGVGGGMDGTVKNLAFLHEMLPQGSTWSASGIGKTHLPILYAALAMGADGVRVGLEDNIYFSQGVKATNVQLVERAVSLAKIAGREIATAKEAREILGIKRYSLKEYRG